MSWIISKALNQAYENSRCLQGQAAESWEGSSLGGEPSAPLSENPTPQAFLSPDKMTAFSRLSRFGMKFAPLTADRGEDLLMWYRAVSLARTFHAPEREQDLTESGAGCGWKWPESSVKFDLATCSWKTRQCSLLEGLDEFSGTWPRWGIMRDGECFPLPPLVPSMSGNGYSYLPTPTCHNAKEGNYPAEHQRNTPLLATHAGGKINPEWTEWLMGWPHGWTDLSQSGTANFQKWSALHGEF